MDKESIIALQRIDCNCNDCIFMVRDFDRLKASAALRDSWQQATFDANRDSILRDAADYDKRGFPDKAANMRKIASRMKYAFMNDSKIAYGSCTKFDRPVSFIPETLQLDTQECFKHRRE